MATIEATDLSKRYGARTALDGLTFTAEPGDVIGLLGPNGAGKTTTIRLLTTILEPTGGTFAVAGVPGDRPNRIRQRIGVLPESAGYPGRQTGAEYLQYAARLFGQSRRDARAGAERLLTDVGLGERAGARISTYSRGMKQRLGIARALVNDPVVVFLDEPTLGLDPAGQREILATIADIAERRGATVVLSTHTLTEVEQVCGSVLILDHGTLRAAGPIAEVVAGTGAASLGAAFLDLTAQTRPDAADSTWGGARP
jgi:ABC-2 type transport system ATP-binding protein